MIKNDQNHQNDEKIIKMMKNHQNHQKIQLFIKKDL
jgi:hypothetical protein